MLSSAVILLLCALSVSEASVLTCHQTNSCPESPVSCECEAIAPLTWRVSEPGAAGGAELCMHRYTTISTGDVSCPGYTSQLDSRIVRDGDFIFNSTLNFTLMENLVVNCASGTGRENTTLLEVASKFKTFKLTAMIYMYKQVLPYLQLDSP